MSIRTIIVDDDAVWRDLTTEFVKMNALLELVGSFDSAIAAYPFLMSEKIDLILLDVEMPQLDGLNFAKSLTHPPLIGFVTSHAESAVEGFEVAATDLLVKPFTFERFFKMTERVHKTLMTKNEPTAPPLLQRNPLGQHEGINDGYFFIRSNNSFVKINVNEVLFIKAMENFIQIVTHNQKHTALIPLSTAEEQLPSDKFMRVHRSYIVNAQNINMMNKDHITMGEFSVPISEQYRDNILKTVIESNLLKK